MAENLKYQQALLSLRNCVLKPYVIIVLTKEKIGSVTTVGPTLSESGHKHLVGVATIYTVWSL